MDDVMTVEQLERQRAERAAAFREAHKLLLGIDSEVEDVLVVADWLIDGRATLALRFSAQTARNYAEHSRDRPSPDATSWTAPLVRGCGESIFGLPNVSIDVSGNRNES